MDTLIFVRGKNIQQQVDQCTAYAEKKGYKVKFVAVGQGDELSDIINGLNTYIDLVLVSDMSRISRNACECYAIQAELELYHGVLIEVAIERAKEVIDLERMLYMQNVIKSASEEYRLLDKIKSRIQYKKAMQ